MENQEQIKKMVREKYSEIAGQDKEKNQQSCCGADACCTGSTYTIFSEDYSQLKGYNPEADLGLGCGVPTEFAQIKEGDTVVDLGSGAGNDCFVVRAVVGEKGKVIGIDMTETMIAKARVNAEKLGLNNVEFRFGEIENLPINDRVADVVISNCVLNLVPDKRKAFSETYRVLKPGGHFSISDMVTNANLPDGLRKAAVMYAGCVAGALQKDEYLSIIKDSGFQNVVVQKERKIDLPDEVLCNYLSKEEVQQFRESNVGIFSITVYAKKPL
ncbi:MAG: arsenite methyltransferase [Chlorobiales bacterium]|nr:arsenite methyltransferase [Chlorobiales bacterium]